MLHKASTNGRAEIKSCMYIVIPYFDNLFDSTTLDTGNGLISKMTAENKRRWEEMTTSTDFMARQSERSLTTQQLQNHLVWSLLTKLHTNCSSTSEERSQQSPSVLNYPQVSEDDSSLVFPFTEEECKKGIATLKEQEGSRHRRCIG